MGGRTRPAERHTPRRVDTSPLRPRSAADPLRPGRRSVDECLRPAQLRRHVDALTVGILGERLVRKQGLVAPALVPDRRRGSSRAPVNDDQLDELSWALWPERSSRSEIS